MRLFGWVCFSVFTQFKYVLSSGLWLGFFSSSFDIHKIDDWELNTISIWKDTRARFGNEFLLYFDKSALIHQKKKNAQKEHHINFEIQRKNMLLEWRNFSLDVYLLSSYSSFNSLLLYIYTHNTQCVHDPNYIDGIDGNGNSTSWSKKKKNILCSFD